MKRVITAGLMVLLLALPSWAMTRKEAGADFVRAGIDYHDGNYQQAEDLYQKVVDAGWESGALYYNLANSYFRDGETGRAVLNYERAAFLMPRDEDLRHNQQFVYSAANLPSEEEGSFLHKALKEHIQFYTFDEMVWIIYALLCLITVVHVSGRFFRWRPGLKVAIFSGLAVVMIGYLGGLVYKCQYYKDLAFIVKPSEAKFEPREQAATHFRLKEGTRVKILRPQGGWVKVKRLDGQMGWIPQKGLEQI